MEVIYTSIRTIKIEITTFYLRKKNKEYFRRFAYTKEI